MRRSAQTRRQWLEIAESGGDRELVEIFRSLHELPQDDPLVVECAFSHLLGTIWSHPRLVDGLDLEATFGESFTRHATTQHTPATLAMLRTLEAIASVESVRHLARAAADVLVGRGVPEPAWPVPVGAVEAGRCWSYQDIFGDQMTVACEFFYGERGHLLAGLVDRNLAGIITRAFLTEDVEATIRTMRRDAMSNGPVTELREVDQAWARRALEQACTRTELAAGTAVAAEFAEWRALLLARLRALPGWPDDEGAAEPAPPSASQRRSLARSFLASEEGAALPDRECAEHLTTLLVDYGSDHDPAQPDRVGPGKWAAFLLNWLPHKAVLDAQDRAALPGFVRAWSAWAARRRKLPGVARDQLMSSVGELLAAFDEAYDNPANFGPARLFLQGLDMTAGAEGLNDTLARRMLAMPYFGTRIGEQDYPQLNPDDLGDLRILVLGEHPEYHHLAPSWPGVRGLTVSTVAAAEHLALHTLVSRQLWQGVPAEVWVAAKRLSESGLDRRSVLHALVDVLRPHVPDLLNVAEPHVDLASYRRALANLRPPGRVNSGRGLAGGARAAGRGPAGDAKPGTAKKRPAEARSGPRSPAATYQIKVSLRGAKPPIWRRLLVPARVPLPDLHAIVQTAMGWQDYHLHMFTAGGVRYGEPDPDGMLDLRNENRVRLRELAPAVGDKIRYEYDFGDGWDHDIVVEKILDQAPPRYPVCLTGRRACPPEDCGGIWGYEHLLEVLADPSHEEYEDILEWVGADDGPFDPAAFDVDEVNEELSVLRIRGR